MEDLASAELAVLGAVLATGGRVLDDTDLQADDFAEPVHADLWQLMRQMRERGQTVDTITLAAANPKRAPFLFTLADHTPFIYAFPEYVDIVASHGLHRRLQAAADGLRGLNPEDGVDAMLARAQELIDGASTTTRRRVRLVRDILPGVIERMKSKATFVPSPWRGLNDVIGGFRPGAVYVIAARPGIGKTVVAAQVAAQLAEHGFVSFSSLEMSEDELVSRLISERLSINVGAVKDNRMSASDWSTLDEGKAKLDSLRIAIDDRAAVSPADIRGHARSVSRNGKLAGIVVDYLQLMASTNQRQDRHVQVADFSRQLKIMAKEFKVPVIALSQLNRESEGRVDKMPRLSDLRESGAIEQDADVVILLSKSDVDGTNYSELTLDVAKNRHGEMRTVGLQWQGEYSRAVSWS